jgi:hypothetical protein
MARLRLEIELDYDDRLWRDDDAKRRLIDELLRSYHVELHARYSKYATISVGTVKVLEVEEVETVDGIES